MLQTATGATLADVWFKHCQFDDLRGSATAPASQGKAIDMQCVGVSLLCDIHILNCYMTNVQNNGFYISCISDTADRINSVFVKGNYNAGCIGRAMQLYRCSTISVEGNIFSGVTADYAIYMLGIHYSLVANNGFGQAGNNLVGSFSNCVSIQSDCSGNQVHHNLGAGRNSGVSVYDGGTGNQLSQHLKGGHFE